MRVPGMQQLSRERAPQNERERAEGSGNVFQLGPLSVKLPRELRLPDALERPSARSGARRRARMRGKVDDGGPLAKIRQSAGNLGNAVKGVGKFQETLMTNVAVRVIAGVSGTLSGLFLAMLAYKVVGGYQDEMKEARREVQRQNQERKARLAQVRRLLSGPLRAAAKDLRNRLESILKTPPRRRSGEPPKIRANYFAAHYPDNPNEAVNSTLFRLCRYLHWVEQFQRGVQLEGVSEQDTWQYALDQQLDRVAHEFEAGDERYDATMPTERLMEVFALAHVREIEMCDDVEMPQRESIFRKIDTSLEDLLNGPVIDVQQEPTKRRVGLKSAEPKERLSRFPMRLFRDTQVALAEVFGELHLHSSKSSGGDAAHGESKVNPHMLYTDFVMKLEEAQLLYERTIEEQVAQGNTDASGILAAQQENLQADPWFRWMLPLQLQIRRLAMLQSQTSKLLTRKEARELLAARARLRGVLNGLNGLLSVLDKRLDDPLFNRPKHNVKASIFNEQKKRRLQGIQKRKAVARWNKIRQAIPYVAKYRRLPPPPTSKRYIRILTGDELITFVRQYKRRAIAGVISAISTAVFTTLLSGFAHAGMRRRDKDRKPKELKDEVSIAPPEDDIPVLPAEAITPVVEDRHWLERFVPEVKRAEQHLSSDRSIPPDSL